jgi:SAM-dependent methyltransferase
MRTNLEWKVWGERDPLWGVASWAGRQRHGAQPWTDEEFYALGDDWLDFQEHWSRYGLVHGKCLEIGCGAGRITARLAQAFTEVVATDVSTGMIDYAATKIPASNIAWSLSDGHTLPSPDAAIDAVFSCHVFQHLPDPEAGFACFREIARVLKPGGSFMIHLPLQQFSEVNRGFATFARLAYRFYSVLARSKAEVTRWRAHFGGQPPMNGVSYDPRSLFDSLSGTGFSRIEFATFPVRTTRGLHSCVMGTKH